jgi:uncharacterized protein YprB with RNaseH-like and TPR domain
MQTVPQDQDPSRKRRTKEIPSQMNKPKVLFFDLETSPNLGYTWGKWEQNVIEFTKEWGLLCFAYKWQGEAEVKCLTKQGRSEKALVKELWKVLDEADVIVAHNLDQFDNKKSKAKFLEYGFGPPSPYKRIDTLKIARANFALNSNKLDDLGATLKLGRKAQTGGFSTWLGCMNGDEKAWAKMIKYNKQDVVLLEKVYNKLRPWATTHPHMGALSGDKSLCPICASSNVQCRGWTIAKVAKKRRMHCQSCSHWWSS